MYYYLYYFQFYILNIIILSNIKNVKFDLIVFIYDKFGLF